MNFLKRAGAILMVVAIFASSCNKYADDFKQLNTKLDALASTVAGLPQLATDLAATKASVAALQTGIAALPTSASVTALATSLTALSGKVDAISTTITAIAAAGTASAAQVAKVQSDLTALATKVAADNASVIASQATVQTKLDALGVNVTGLATKLTALQTASDALAVAVAKVQAGGDANALGIAALAATLSTHATAIAKVSSDLAANSAANATAATAAATAATAAATAVLNDVAASAQMIAAQGLLAGQITAVQTALAGMAMTGSAANTDATALTVQGLQLQMNAINATLAVIVANTTLKIGVPTITITGGYGVPSVGAVMNANLSSILEAGASIQWNISATGTGSWTAISGATTATYTVQASEVGKYYQVVVTGVGSYKGTTNTSVATAAAVANIALTSVATPVISSTATPAPTAFQVGVNMKLGLLAPYTVAQGATVTYQWQTSPTLTGVYSTVATTATYTPVAADANMFLRVVVTGTAGFNGVVTSPSTVITVGPVTAINWTSGISNNLVTITLTSGTFKGSTATYPNSDLVASDFTWTGVDAGKFTNALTVTTKVSPTVVTVQLGAAAVLIDNTVNAVAIPAATLATPATTVPTVASSSAISVPVPIAAVAASPTFSMSGMNTLVITMTGGSFKSGTISASDFTFTGGDAALIQAGTFTRTSANIVTVTNIVAGLAANNTVAVPAATQATQGTSVAGVGKASLTAGAVALTGENVITVTMTGGTLKTSGLAQSDLVFTGTDAVALGSATVTYTGTNTFQISGFSGLVGADNVVTLKASGQATQGTSIAAASDNIVALTTPAFAVSAAAGTVTVTLVGGTFPAGLATANFSSTTCTIGAVTYLTSTTASIALSGAVVGSNTIVLKQSGQLTAGTSVSVTTSY